MKIFWWRKPHRDEAESESAWELSPRARAAVDEYVRRVRNGQDVESEQFLAQLRNKHF